MLVPENISAVLGRVIQLCGPPDLGPRWSHLERDHNCGLLDADTTAIWESLQQEFSADDLLAAHVAVRENGQLQLNPQLITDDQLVVLLRDKKNRPYDIVTSTGALSWCVPALAVGKGCKPCAGQPSPPQRLYLVSSLREVCVLRSLGLYAAPLTNLDRLGKVGLQGLLSLVGGTTEGPLRNGPSGGKYQLAKCEAILVACDIVNLTRTISPQIFAVAKDLDDASRYLNIRWGSLCVWWPSREELAKLDYQRRMQCGELIDDFFKNLEGSYALRHFRDPARLPRRRDSYTDKLRQLLEAQRLARREAPSEHFATKYRTAAAEYTRQVDRLIFAPLLKNAEDSDDLALRALRLQLAHVARLLQRAMPDVHAAQAERIANIFPPESFLPGDTWKQAEVLMDKMLKLIQVEHRLLKKTYSR